MAKETNHSPVLLFITAGLLSTGAWLMASFPIFIFFGLAPLFALTDRADNTSSVWEKMEWVLLSLTIYFLAAHAFDFSFIVSSMVYAILFTLPFIGYVWIRQTLGKRVVKITIVFLWLSIEYILLKINLADSIFLSDALRLQPNWMHWNVHTGYLGASCWILLTNLLVYQALLSGNPFQWHWIVSAVVFLGGPLTYSFYLNTSPVTHNDMVNLYSGKSMIKDVVYLARAEWVVRTATWLSTLILLFTLVKSQTTKR